MAATELTHSPWRVRSPQTAAFLYAYAAVWVLTFAAAGAVALGGGPVTALVRATLDLRLTPAQQTPGVGRAFGLAAHNMPLAAWPLLLGPLRARESSRARRAAEALLAACLLANCVPVGAAFGAYGLPLLPYVVQLPLEWAGLALGYGSWLLERRAPLSRQRRLALAGVIATTLLAAAALESYATPHEHDAHPSRLEQSRGPLDKRSRGN